MMYVYVSMYQDDDDEDVHVSTYKGAYKMALSCSQLNNIYKKMISIFINLAHFSSRSRVFIENVIKNLFDSFLPVPYC